MVAEIICNFIIIIPVLTLAEAQAGPQYLTIALAHFSDCKKNVTNRFRRKILKILAYPLKKKIFLIQKCKNRLKCIDKFKKKKHSEKYTQGFQREQIIMYKTISHCACIHHEPIFDSCGK